MPVQTTIGIPHAGASEAHGSDRAAALARSDVTDGELAQIAEAHNMHIVGPPSDRYV
jgi:hypothetical protein